jgi:hypothetical protein
MIIVRNSNGETLRNKDGEVIVFKSPGLARVAAVASSMTDGKDWEQQQLPRLPLSLPGEFN